MQLSKDNLGQIAVQHGIEVPDARLFELPEKVLQFGTGVLLRGLPDYFIDKANKKGIFNGRVVIVKTTASESASFEEQDGLYTQCIRGFEGERIMEENIINASISRVLWARNDWDRILECAHNPQLSIIISNTTEIGIALVDDDIRTKPPVSFPGKLLAFLFERFKAFNGSAASGMTIVPTELITDNGSKLESYVLELAHLNNLEFRFIEWLENHNTFCNSLVDRIVPGLPNKEEKEKIEDSIGYTDDLMIVSEVFRLWAIEGGDSLKNTLSFCEADAGVMITTDITVFKELKLRLLNGTHTLSACLAILYGLGLTREAMADKAFAGFMNNLLYGEIAEAIPYEMDNNLKEDFASKVLNRFANPYIDHQWLSITVQQTAKMKMRVIPLLLKHYSLFGTPPLYMTVCFAAYLQFMKPVRKENGRFFGIVNGIEYEIKDDEVEFFYETWKNNPAADVPAIVLRNESLWDTDLSVLPLFLETVQQQLTEMTVVGVKEAVKKMETIKISA